jgi:DnaK suppressor protein
MNSPTPSLDPSFISGQRQKLVDERLKLSSAMNRGEDENRLTDLAARGQSDEAEELAQDLTITENNRILIETLANKRRAIDRALAKIDEGTYGFSDVSGQPIPLARLLAFPEAIRTTAEESAQQGKAQPADV